MLLVAPRLFAWCLAPPRPLCGCLFSPLHVGDGYGSVPDSLHGSNLTHLPGPSRLPSAFHHHSCVTVSKPPSPSQFCSSGFKHLRLVLGGLHTPQLINAPPEGVFCPPKPAPAPSFSNPAGGAHVAKSSKLEMSRVILDSFPIVSRFNKWPSSAGFPEYFSLTPHHCLSSGPSRFLPSRIIEGPSTGFPDPCPIPRHVPHGSQSDLLKTQC